MNNAKALEIWSAQTLADIGILLSVVSFALHVARPYFERILGRLTLRVASDLWWEVYVVLRDGTLFAAAVLGFFHLNLDLMADIKVGVPFVPIGTVALMAALLVKVFRNTEDVKGPYLVAFWLVGLGAFLNALGWVFVMEAPGKEYAAAQTAFWRTLVSWRSNANPSLTTGTFYVAIVLLAVLAIAAAVLATAAHRRAAVSTRAEEGVRVSP